MHLFFDPLILKFPYSYINPCHLNYASLVRNWNRSCIGETKILLQYYSTFPPEIQIKQGMQYILHSTTNSCIQIFPYCIEYPVLGNFMYANRGLLIPSCSHFHIGGHSLSLQQKSLAPCRFVQPTWLSPFSAAQTVDRLLTSLRFCYNLKGVSPLHS